MRVTATVQVIGKVAKTWKDKDGVEHLSYSANIMQNNGEIIDTIRMSKEVFESTVAGKAYTATFDYGTGSNGGFLRLTGFTEIK